MAFARKRVDGDLDICHSGAMKKLLSPILTVVAVGSLTLATGCREEEKTYSAGFRLPEGDAAVGKVLFVEIQCNRCHTVEGVKLPDRDLPVLPKIHLGGEIHRVKSYGELVTSVISPQHVISPQYLKMLSEEEKEKGVDSPMPIFNEDISVKQLTDLVAFLHSRYRLIDPSGDEYYYVMP